MSNGRFILQLMSITAAAVIAFLSYANLITTDNATTRVESAVMCGLMVVLMLIGSIRVAVIMASRLL